MPVVNKLVIKDQFTAKYDFIIPADEWNSILIDVWQQIITSSYCGMSYLKAKSRITQFGSQIGSYFEPLLEDRLSVYGFARSDSSKDPDFIYPLDRKYDFELKTGKGVFPATNKSTVSGTSRKKKATYMLFIRYNDDKLVAAYMGKPLDSSWNIPEGKSVQIATMKAECFDMQFTRVYKGKD